MSGPFLQTPTVEDLAEAMKRFPPMSFLSRKIDAT